MKYLVHKLYHPSFFLLLFIFTHQARSQDNSLYFSETDNKIIVDLETIKPTPGWSFRVKENGYYGSGYFEWMGSDRFNQPGIAPLSYKIKINTPGIYQFIWHSKTGKGTNSTEHNDSWLKFPDAADFYGEKTGTHHIVHPHGDCTTDCPNGSGGKGWFKVYLSGTTSWTWETNTSDSDPHKIFARFDTTGFYTVLIAGRSKNHLIDRFVLFNKDSLDQNAAISAKNNSFINPLYTPKMFNVAIDVKNKEGKAVQDFELILNNNNKIFSPNGPQLIINSLKEGNYYLETSSPSWLNQSQTLYLEHDTLLCFITEPAFNIHFRVLQPDGCPSKNAEITFAGTSLKTNASGEVVFENIVKGIHTIKVIKYPFQNYISSISCSKDSSINIRLVEYGTTNIPHPSTTKHIYPNPVNEELFFSIKDSQISSVEIFNSTGTTILSIHENIQSVKLNTLPAGIYFIHIKTKTGYYSGSFFKID